MLATDPEAFDCETCPTAQALGSLDEPNREAWRIFRLLASRFLVDLHAGGHVLDRLTADLDVEQFEDLMQRLRILYDVLCPVPQRPATES